MLSSAAAGAATAGSELRRVWGTSRGEVERGWKLLVGH